MSQGEFLNTNHNNHNGPSSPSSHTHRVSGLIELKETGPDSKVLQHLFNMAENYRASNSLNSAIEMYFMFISDHSGTVQAEMSKNRLLEIAGNYEKIGLSRQARALYEQLL